MRVFFHIRYLKAVAKGPCGHCKPATCITSDPRTQRQHLLLAATLANSTTTTCHPAATQRCNISYTRQDKTRRQFMSCHRLLLLLCSPCAAANAPQPSHNLQPTTLHSSWSVAPSPATTSSPTATSATAASPAAVSAAAAASAFTSALPCLALRPPNR